MGKTKLLDDNSLVFFFQVVRRFDSFLLRYNGYE